jgi:hypothetical protein
LGSIDWFADFLIAMMPMIQKLLGALGMQPAPGSRTQASHPAAHPDRVLKRKRQRMLDGFIASEGMLSARACTVLDLTALGASVEIWDTNVKSGLISGTVLLYIPSDHQEVECSVQWRRDKTLGLKFNAPFREPSRTYR